MFIEEILIVRHDGNLYGINSDVIEHILRVLDITPLPFAPKEVRGFCSIEGSILTVLDLSRLLLEDKSIDASTDEARLISVFIDNMHYSVLLEEVINNVTINQKNIEYVSQEDRRRDGVVAAYKYEGDIIQVLDLQRLILNIKKLTFEKREFSDKYEAENSRQIKEDQTSRYFIFMMSKEQYAIDVNNIREVITVPKSFTEMSDCGPEVLGMMTLRDEIVITIDLRIIYNLPAGRGDANRIIVVQLGNKVVGLLIDSIVDIADFVSTDIDVMPSNFRDDKIEAIAHRGKDLISLVNIEVINKIIDAESRVDNSIRNDSVKVEATDMIEVVSFYLDGKCYALHTENVVEIIDTFDITNVTDMPEIVDGITNIRGKVIPVISLYNKLKLKRHDTGQRMLVSQYKGNDIGILVDEVRDVSNIAKELFIPEEESDYFSEIIKIDEKNVILMIDLENLLA